ncbi:MAG: dTMP kinase [Chloroflexi bacterium]|nr:MAG: dTMP kinase [Chloroflexota bacterium]PIE81296.1 MAG: dTMP kinase [Chloroflexota bacterium]
MFITFEGPEGSGKTSQIILLAEYLRGQGYDVIQTREPGGTAIGNQIRDVLHDVKNGEMQSVTELLLYSASRAQLVRELVQPALAAGKIILCDRYADSTIAYQGYGRGLDLQDLLMLTQFATGGLKPHLTLLLDIDVERGLARRQTGGDEMNRLDLEAVSFHQKVRNGYHALAEAEPERWLIVDADRSVEKIQADLREIVTREVAARQRSGVAA